jgi:hypothetical protein
MDGLERVEAETVEDVEAVEAASSTLSAAAASVQELSMDGQQTLQGGAAVGSKESVRNAETIDGAKKKSHRWRAEQKRPGWANSMSDGRSGGVCKRHVCEVQLDRDRLSLMQR